MANKLGRVMTSLDRLLPIMPHDPLVTRPCQIPGSLTGGGSARKRLSRHQLLVTFLKNYIKVIFIESFFSNSCINNQSNFSGNTYYS